MTLIEPARLLNELLDDELNSPARFIQESVPYIEPELRHLREPLKRMLESRRARSTELIKLLQTLDVEPASYRLHAEEQYLAFLSLKFLLPRLIEWKNRAILLHERALMLAGEDSPLHQLISRHLQQHQAELAALSAK
jgi:hypothetical protein